MKADSITARTWPIGSFQFKARCRAPLGDARKGAGRILVRADSRFFSGILHPHLLGGCRPNRFLGEWSKHVAHAQFEHHRRGQLIAGEILINGKFRIGINLHRMNVKFDSR